MRLTLIRHPRADTAPDVCVGQLDLDCAPGWEAHAGRIARVLGRADRLVSSPLARCASLAHALADHAGLRPEFDPRLMELHFGQWEGRRWSEIDRPAGEPDGAGFLDDAPPGGESYRSLVERVRALLLSLPSGSDAHVALVTHAGPIRAALTSCLGLEPARGWRFDVGYGRVTRLAERDGGWRLEVLNA